MTSERRVNVLDLSGLPRKVTLGSLWGRWEFCAAAGSVKDSWLEATADERLSAGWGDSWNNACYSTGPRAIYRVICVEDDDDADIAYATLVCVKALR